MILRHTYLMLENDTYVYVPQSRIMCGFLQFTVILQLVDRFIHLSQNKHMYILLRSSAVFLR